MAQFESRKKEMKDAGAQVVFVAAEKRGGLLPPESYFARHPFSFPYLLDEDRELTKAYGVYHWLSLDAYNIAHPATFILDRRGIIRYIFVSENQLERAPIDDLLSAVRELVH